jgi:hypothetical protein
MYDVGAANMLLTMQANSMRISTYLMGGFDRKKITDLLPLEADAVPVVMIVLDFAGDAGKLEVPFKTSELAPRSRKAFSEIKFHQP